MTSPTRIRGAQLSPSLNIGLGMTLGQGTVYLATPLLARLYTPTEIGLMALFTSTASFLAAVSTLRLEYFITASSDELSQRAQRYALASALAFSLVGAGCYPLLFPEAGILQSLLLAITAFAMASIAVLLQTASRRFTFGGIAAGRASLGLGQTAVQIGGGLAGGGLGPLLGGLAAGYSLNALIQLFWLRTTSPASDVSVRRSDSKVRIPWGKACSLTLAAFANVLTTTAITYMLVYAFSSSTAGQYNISQRIVVAPVALLVATVAPVLIGEVARNIRLHEPIWPGIVRWIRRLLPLALIVSVVMLIVPASWVESITGPGYPLAAPMLRAMTPLVASQILLGGLGQVLPVCGWAAAQLLWDVLRLCAVLAGGLWVIQTNGSPVTLAWTYSIIVATFYLLYTVAISVLNKQLKRSST